MKNIVRLLSISILLFAVSVNPIFAEAGLSEAGRTRYYFWDENYGVSILPGGEGAAGDDYVSIFKYEEVSGRTDSVQIKGLDGKKYTYAPDNTSHHFYSPPTVTEDIVWSDSLIFNLKTGEIIYDEHFECTDSPDESYGEYALDSERCAEYVALLDTFDLSSDNQNSIVLDLDYAEENLAYMGNDAFLESMGTFLLVFFIILGILALMEVTGIVLLIIGLIFRAKKKNGRKWLIAGGILCVIPIIAAVGYWVFISTRMVSAAYRFSS